MRRHNRVAPGLVNLSNAISQSFGAADEVWDIHTVYEDDGTRHLLASYRVDRHGKMHWLTLDGRPPAGWESSTSHPVL